MRYKYTIWYGFNSPLSKFKNFEGPHLWHFIGIFREHSVTRRPATPGAPAAVGLEDFPSPKMTRPRAGFNVVHIPRRRVLTKNDNWGYKNKHTQEPELRPTSSQMLTFNF